MTEEQTRKNSEKKLALNQFADIAVRVLSPSILESTGKVFSWDLDYYTAHSNDSDSIVRDFARTELAKSAQLYLCVIDKYAPFTPNPSDYVSKRESVESILNKLEGPSAMWDVQPGA